MKCQHYDKHIYDYTEGKLSFDLRLSLENHLKECQLCRNKLELTQIENEVLRNTEHLSKLSPEFTSRVLCTISSTEVGAYPPPAKTGLKTSLPRKKRFTLFAASTVITVALTVGLYLPGLNLGSRSDVAESPPTLTNKAPSGHQEKVVMFSDGVGNTQDQRADIMVGGVQNPNQRTKLAQNPVPKAGSMAESDKQELPLDSYYMPQNKSYEFSSITSGIAARDRQTDEGISGRGENQRHQISSETSAFTYKPENLPPELELSDMEAGDADEEKLYTYLSGDGQKKLQIKVVSGATLPLPGETEQAISNTKSENSAEQPAQSLDQSLLTREFTVNNKNIIVTFSSNLSQEQLVQIAENITFREEAVQ